MSETSSTRWERRNLEELNLVVYNQAIFLLNPSKRKDCKGARKLKCEKYSSHVSNPCARMIRNLGSLNSFIQESIQGEISKSTLTKAIPVKKRLLEMPDPQIG